MNVPAGTAVIRFYDEHGSQIGAEAVPPFVATRIPLRLPALGRAYEGPAWQDEDASVMHTHPYVDELTVGGQG